MRPVKLTLGLLVLVLVILLIGVGVVWYDNYGNQNSQVNTYTTANTPYKVLMQSNEAFSQAQEAVRNGDYAKAQTLYQQALVKTTDTTQRGQIEFKIAAMLAKQKNNDLAISMYKSIVSNQVYANYGIVKAYSLQSMAELYFSTGDASVTKSIFSDEPYKSMLTDAGGDASIAYRKLEEYAVSFYPLGIPELRIAGWYVNNYETDPSATSSESIIGMVKNAVTLSNADIERIKTDADLATLIPGTLTRQCALYLNVYEAKLGSADDADAVCKNALDTFTTITQAPLDGYARFYYAVLLSEQGPSHTSEVISVLEPFSQTPSQYTGQDSIRFFANERTDQLHQKKRLVTLAGVSPDFKNFLISLGWNAQDFTSSAQ